jgi:hypothetical protein
MFLYFSLFTAFFALLFGVFRRSDIRFSVLFHAVSPFLYFFIVLLRISFLPSYSAFFAFSLSRFIFPSCFTVFFILFIVLFGIFRLSLPRFVFPACFNVFLSFYYRIVLRFVNSVNFNLATSTSIPHLPAENFPAFSQNAAARNKRKQLNASQTKIFLYHQN